MGEKPEDYLAKEIAGRRNRRPRPTLPIPPKAQQEEADPEAELRGLTRHALKLWIFIGWAVIILSAGAALVGFLTALAQQ